MKTRLLVVALAASLASASLMLLLVCSAIPLAAQQTAPPSGTQGAQPATSAPQYPIGCLSATGCKKNYVPIFDSTGGSATITDSLLSLIQTTPGNYMMNLAGSETATGDLFVGGQVNANTVDTIASTGGVNSTMTGSGNDIAAITGSATATGEAGFTFGVVGQSASDSGRGVFGLSTGNGGVGVIGENNNGPGIGVAGKALPGSTGYGVYGSGPIGVFGTGSNYGFQTDSNVQQSRTAGGWVKAMMYVNGATSPYNIVRCFNSTLAGAAATTPPCGITLAESSEVGEWTLTFNFEVDDRFWVASTYLASSIGVEHSAPDTLFVDTTTGGSAKPANFTVIVF